LNFSRSTKLVDLFGKRQIKILLEQYTGGCQLFSDIADLSKRGVGLQNKIWYLSGYL